MQYSSNIVNKYKKLHLAVFGLFIFATVISATNQIVYAAPCPTPSTDYGTATQVLNIETAGNYRVWSRIKAPDTSNNSYLLEIDGATCVTVGDSAITANTWTWVDYQSGSTTTKTDVSLSATNHTFKMIGREPGVQLDKVIFIAIVSGQVSCVPTGDGSNCSDPPDTTLPAVSLTAPANNATLANPQTISATASDDVAVTSVEFLVDGAIVGTDTTSPYTYSWNTSAVSNGAHSITASAYDAAGNTRTSTAVSVNKATTATGADMNGDNVVNLTELSIMANNFGQAGRTLATGDLNGDGVVNVLDLSILATNWPL